VHVVDPTPHAAGRLFEVCPDVSEPLTVVTLRKYIPGFVRLNLDRKVAKVW
jgi:hypothetical protein